MSKLDLTDVDRLWRTNARSLTTDSQGRETLIGLTFEESVWYLDYEKRRSSGELRRGPQDVRRRDHDQHEALRMRHEQCRMQIVSAENEARLDTQRH